MRLPNMSYCERSIATALTLTIAFETGALRIALNIIANCAAGGE